jgi:hypothetical protein
MTYMGHILTENRNGLVVHHSFCNFLVALKS